MRPKELLLDRIAALAEHLGLPNTAKRSMTLVRLVEVENELRRVDDDRRLRSFVDALPAFVNRYSIVLVGEPWSYVGSVAIYAEVWTVSSVRTGNGWSYGTYWTRAEADRVAAVLRECANTRHATGQFAVTFHVEQDKRMITDHDLRMAGLMKGRGE